MIQNTNAQKYQHIWNIWCYNYKWQIIRNTDLQRDRKAVIVTSLIECVPPFLAAKQKFSEDSPKVNAGCFGLGRGASPFNMTTTSDMVGLSFASSCTHKSAIWMHLNTSWEQSDKIIDESMISRALPSLHSSQTCRFVNSINQKSTELTIKINSTRFFWYLHGLSSTVKHPLGNTHFSFCCSQPPLRLPQN